MSHYPMMVFCRFITVTIFYAVCSDAQTSPRRLRKSPVDVSFEIPAELDDDCDTCSKLPEDSCLAKSPLCLFRDGGCIKNDDPCFKRFGLNESSCLSHWFAPGCCFEPSRGCFSFEYYEKERELGCPVKIDKHTDKHTTATIIDGNMSLRFAMKTNYQKSVGLRLTAAWYAVGPATNFLMLQAIAELTNMSMARVAVRMVNLQEDAGTILTTYSIRLPADHNADTVLSRLRNASIADAQNIVRSRVSNPGKHKIDYDVTVEAMGHDIVKPKPPLTDDLPLSNMQLFILFIVCAPFTAICGMLGEIGCFEDCLGCLCCSWTITSEGIELV